MALNLKTLGVRSLTAAAFAAVLLGGILCGYTTFSLLFFFVSIAGLFEFFRIARKLSVLPFEGAGYAMAILINLCFILSNVLRDIQGQILLILIVFPFVLMAVGLFSKRSDPLKDVLYTIGGLMYAVMPFALLHEIIFASGASEIPVYTPDILLGIIFLIWINDTFAYLGGSLFGKHKMMPSVSPGKTWEGTLTGILCAAGISFLFGTFFHEHPAVLWPLLGVVVPVLATIGDLVQSQIKRQAGVKDSGSIMPGHGGILDRFDSLIFVTPFVVVILKLL